MKVLLTILAVVLMAPVLPLVGIALGPAALVILFIVGIALIMAGPGRSGWLRERGRITRARARSAAAHIDASRPRARRTGQPRDYALVGCSSVATAAQDSPSINPTLSAALTLRNSSLGKRAALGRPPLAHGTEPDHPKRRSYSAPPTALQAVAFESTNPRTEGSIAMAQARRTPAAKTPATSKRSPAAKTKASATRKRTTTAPRPPTAVDKTKELSEEVLDSLEKGQRTAIEAVRKFVDTVDHTLPALPHGEGASKRQEIVDSALEMADRLVHAQYDFIHKVIDSAGKSLTKSDRER
jgi:hypothetical protein